VSSDPTTAPIPARRFAGAVCAVTGAAHGIGRATAERLASEGGAVAVLDVDAAGAEATAARIRERGERSEAFACDITDQPAVERVAGEVAARLGLVSVLHNNAGFLRAGTALEQPLEVWDRTLDVNVRGLLLVTRAFLGPMLEAGRGAIVNTASVGGLFGVPRLAAYNASKGAVVNLTRQLAVDYTRLGVRVNCVCPGWVPTGFNEPLLKGVTDEELAALVDRTVPAGRQADPAEIAAAVAFLASDDASYVSGHALVVDGAMTASL